MCVVDLALQLTTQCGMGRDFTIFAQQPGYVRFYTDKKYPGQTSMRRINLRKYCASVAPAYIASFCLMAALRWIVTTQLTTVQAALSSTRTNGYHGTRRRAGESGGSGWSRSTGCGAT